MRPYEHEVIGFVSEIWSTMLGLAVYPDERALALAEQGDAIVGRVWITGAWRGMVTLDCDPRLARHAAAAMFGVPPETTSTEQVEDALGELANMTSGNFKSLLPEPCSLSPPRAGQRGKGTIDDSDAPILGRFGFQCLDLAFFVTVSTADSNG
jgi:chemotaxis protein CheX